ncbi:MAG: hypothetical protein RMK20_16045, partial [Verrucomicrobiales bacterium]|nr:hypothetical protein [Verrucomicrobiales bacterium]
VENFTPTPTNLTYRLQFRLLNSANAPFPILETNGVTNATYTFNLVTNLTLLAGQKLLLTNAAALRPAARLDPYDAYRIECRLFRGGVDTGLVRTDGPYQFFHFTNLLSTDLAYNILTRLAGAQTNRIYMINTASGLSNFLFTLNYETYCYDNFTNPANPIINFPLVFDFALRTAGGLPVPLATNRLVFTDSTFSYEPGSSNPVMPRVRIRSTVLPIVPAVQLDSVNQTYYLQVTISHTNEPGQPALAGNSTNSTTERLLHFNGRLDFGSIQTTFSSIANHPAPGTLGAGFINTVLAVNNNSGVVIGNPGHTYGDGTPLNVRLRSNGIAELASGSVVLNAPSPDTATVAGVRITRGRITLDTAGARANVTVILPTGFSYTTNAANLDTLRYHEATLDFINIPLGQSLTPTASTLTYAPATGVWCSEETKPLWIGADGLVWNVNAGSFTVGISNTFLFHTRFWENYFQAYYSLLTVDPATMWFKRDNNGYYNYVDYATTTNLAVVYANADGAAEMSFIARFNNGQFRTHFPYDTHIAWTNRGTLIVE